MKKVITVLVIIAIIVTFGIVYYMNTRIVYNDESVYGNTSGNLLNGGLYCEENGKIYFSNENDRGNLYVMDNDCTNFKKLTDDMSSHINVAGKYIYYSRKNNERDPATESIFVFSNVGIYRINKSGSAIACLYNDPAGAIFLAGNYVYYQRYSEKEKPTGLSLFKVKIDGKDNTLLSKDPINPIAIQNDVLYYTGTDRDHNIYRMDLSSGSSSLLYEGNAAYCVVQDNYIYFMDQENNLAITRMNLDGSNVTTLIEEKTSTYNISLDGTYIYYQIDEGENNGLYRYNSKTGISQLITSGYYNSIHVTSSYVFFREFNTNIVYMISSGADTTLATFNPPAQK